MKKVLVILSSFLTFAICLSCDSKKNTEASVESIAEENILTSEEKAAGWQLLFDGKSTNGWKIFKDRKNNTWEVVDGVLHCKALDEVTGDGNERSDLMTTSEFENFELQFDWKIGAEGNSGVIFHVTEEFEQPYFTGPEYQLMDDLAFPNETPDHLTGSNYGMHPAGKTILKPQGEWNHSSLIVNHNHVEHWLNGSKLFEYELNSSGWQEFKKTSKWGETASYGAAAKGYLVLQDHGSEAWFRNVKIKPL
jgi:hypothetical protein